MTAHDHDHEPDDVAAQLVDGWTTELHETRPRSGDHHHGSHHQFDIVIRLRKDAK